MDEIDLNKTMAPTLDVTLVPTESEKEPDEADFLAQSNQDAGGNQEDKALPTTPSPAMFSTADNSASPLFMPKMEQALKPKQIEKEILTAQQADMKIFSQEQDPKERPETKSITTPEILARSKEIAKLSAELDEQIQAFAKKPRQKFIHSRTKEYKSARYIVDWKKKIERVGLLNFPGEAKRKNLYGNLLLDVAIYANGTIADISVRRSSGYKILDDAAINIVRIAAPFSPFSEKLRKDTDILHITRTWKFLPGGNVKTVAQ
jgi:protein TonB